MERPSKFRPYSLIAIALGMVGLLALPFDIWLVDAVNMTASSGDTKRIFALSEIFAHGFGVVIAIGFIACFAKEQLVKVPRLLSCILSTALIVHIFKWTIARRRPQSYGQYPESIGVTWSELPPKTAEGAGANAEFLIQSFPSGHTAAAFCLAFGLSYLFPKGRYLFFALGIMAMFQRIMFKAHWPSDVCFGAAIAMLSCAAFYESSIGNRVFGKWESGASVDVIDKSSLAQTRGNFIRLRPTGCCMNSVCPES